MFPAFSWELGQDRQTFKLDRCRISKTNAGRQTALAIALTAISVFAQQKPVPPTPAAGVEFPVLMQQKITAGKSRVGTKIHAKLVIATLVKGTVIPEGAILSGEVTESAAKSATGPSRLGVRMDSAQWKNGSIPIKVYLTAWYYPVTMPDQEVPSGGLDGSVSPASGSPARLGRNRRPIAQPSSDADAPSLPAPSISQHRALLKNVEFTRNSDGAVTLTSKRSNLKLDKATTYVFAADGLLRPK
jgi:hypothetical protein